MNIDLRALFADETRDYRIPEEPDEGQLVTLRFRTAKDDADQVAYIEERNQYEAVMKKISSDDRFDYYEHLISVGSEVITYYFLIKKQSEICYFNRLGAVREIGSGYAFRITPGFHTPEWAKGAVMYQIFVDRFCNGDSSNDVLTNEYIYIGRPVSGIKDWNSTPEVMDVGRFYGGDLKGVWNKLDYLQHLGIEAIYFNPLFVSPSNHKYDCQDYDHIDPHYGVLESDEGELIAAGGNSNRQAARYQTRTANQLNLDASDAFFAEFTAAAHERGIKIIIDGVFNHCGSFHKWLDREGIYEAAGDYEAGAYVSADSPYRSFFKFGDQNSWPYNHSYEGWWGHETLPKLNYEGSGKLYEYILAIARKWLSPPFHVDGWRLDVAADLGHSSEYNHQFWRDFRKTVKAANPDALILAEHYGDPSSWLAGDQWDSVMNYDAFMEPLSWFLTGMEKHSDEYNSFLYGDGEGFFRSMNCHMARLQTPSLMTAMNQLSNHDHSRFLTRTNQQVGRLETSGSAAADINVNDRVFRAAVMILMTWPGAPTLYYGDEAGLCGWTDPDNRRTYPWGSEDQELIEFHRYMIALHKRLPALRRGSLKRLLADRQLIAYGRMSGDNKCVVAVNNRSSEREISIPVWELGIKSDEELVRVMLTDSNGYNVGALKVPVIDGDVILRLPASSSVLLTTAWADLI